MSEKFRCIDAGIDLHPQEETALGISTIAQARAEVFTRGRNGLVSPFPVGMSDLIPVILRESLYELRGD